MTDTITASKMGNKILMSSTGISNSRSATHTLVIAHKEYKCISSPWNTKKPLAQGKPPK